MILDTDPQNEAIINGIAYFHLNAFTFDRAYRFS